MPSAWKFFHPLLISLLADILERFELEATAASDIFELGTWELADWPKPNTDVDSNIQSLSTSLR